MGTQQAHQAQRARRRNGMATMRRKSNPKTSSWTAYAISKEVMYCVILGDESFALAQVTPARVWNASRWSEGRPDLPSAARSENDAKRKNAPRSKRRIQATSR